MRGARRRRILAPEEIHARLQPPAAADFSETKPKQNQLQREQHNIDHSRH